jgi:hypothetical protein
MRSGKAIRLLEPVEIKGERRALVTILDEEPAVHGNETALLSEAALAQDWNRSEEDAAWSYLQGSSGSPVEASTSGGQTMVGSAICSNQWC